MGSPRALKEWGSFSLCCRIHQELTHEPLGMPGSCTSLQMAHGTLHAPCTLPTKTPILSSSLSTLPTVVRVSFGRCLLSTCRMLAHVCRPGRDHKLELQLHPWESKREAVSTWPGVLQDAEKVYKFKNSATRGSIKCGAGLSISLRKPQNPQQI